MRPHQLIRDDLATALSKQLLIRRMNKENPFWVAPHVHGELFKRGIQAVQSTLAKYIVRSGPRRSQTWKTFLHNHAAGKAAMDFLIVLTIGVKLHFVWSFSATSIAT